MLTVGSLFSGMGGLDYGLEQAGMETVWQVEYDDWAREALNQNFPQTEKFKDVREVGKHNLRHVDLICGGFPCQDISTAKRDAKGLEGEQSGLWFEYKRIIRELRPSYIVIENVAALLIRGLDRVLSDLAGLGYDAEWQTLRASAFGLATRRKRLFIVAYANGLGLETELFKSRIAPSDAERELQIDRVFVEDLGRSFLEIPKHLRMADGVSVEFSALKPVLKGYGNAVAPPVAKWIGERIIEFDRSITPPTAPAPAGEGIDK